MKGHSSPSKRSWLLRISLLAVFLVLFFSFLGFSFKDSLITGGESEFSPSSFQHRSRQSYGIPFLNLTLISIESGPYRKKIVMYWINKGYFKHPNNEANEWDMISSWSQKEGRPRNGPARDFWNKTGCSNDDISEEWIKWSESHPDLANQLWPKIIWLLHEAQRGNKYHVCYSLAAVLLLSINKKSDRLEFTRSFSEWEKYYNAVNSEFELFK